MTNLKQTNKLITSILIALALLSTAVSMFILVNYKPRRIFSVGLPKFLTYEEALNIQGAKESHFVLSPDGTEIWDPDKKHVIPLQQFYEEFGYDIYKPITYTEALRVGREEAIKKFVISPDGKTIYNPITRTEMPYNEESWQAPDYVKSLNNARLIFFVTTGLLFFIILVLVVLATINTLTTKSAEKTSN